MSRQYLLSSGSGRYGLLGVSEPRTCQLLDAGSDLRNSRKGSEPEKVQPLGITFTDQMGSPRWRIPAGRAPRCIHRC